MLVHSVIVNLCSPTPKVEQSAEQSWLACHLSPSVAPRPPPAAHIFPVLKISDKTSEPRKRFNAKRKLCACTWADTSVCSWVLNIPVCAHIISHARRAVSVCVQMLASVSTYSLCLGVLCPRRAYPSLRPSDDIITDPHPAALTLPPTPHSLLWWVGCVPPPTFVLLLFLLPSSCRAFNASLLLHWKCWIITAGHSTHKADMGQVWGVCLCMSLCVLVWWIYNQYSATSQPLCSCKAVAVLMNCDSHGVHYDSR